LWSHFSIGWRASSHQMARVEGDFAKGGADGTIDALAVVCAAAEAWQRAGPRAAC
jgi:hypothetical protein